MKTFMKRKWHRIPVGIIGAVMAVLLIATSVFAAYSFISGTINLTVEEPMTVEYDWPNDGYGWIPVTGGSIPIDVSGVAGDSETFSLRVCNAANNDLTVSTTLGGHTGKVTITGLPNGTIPAEGCWTGSVTATINGDTAPGPYTLTLDFARS